MGLFERIFRPTRSNQGAANNGQLFYELRNYRPVFHDHHGEIYENDLIREAIKLDKGSGKPNTEKVGKITEAQVREIAEKKMPQMNAIDIEGARKILAGTARSMGVTVVD